jgi:hypothetical protein
VPDWLRRKATVFAVSSVVLFGGSLLLAAIGAPLWLVLSYVVAVWAGLTYWAILRARRR